DFYLVHTAIVVPTIEPKEWSMRIHGMVENEINLTYQELIDRPLKGRWITLNCVSNPVGGDLIGNAWWNGISLAALLEEAGVSDGADAVLQTSHDGWTCGTPLSALLDRERGSMLAIAMNGEPLPIDHGFPVRTIVPGLYGYVSACKWVVDIEVTRFSDIEAFWTEKGWAEKGPVKVASRIEVPSSGADLDGEKVVVGGYAWAQDIGIAAVQIAVDGGAWFEVTIAEVPNEDTWVQWKGEIMVPEGDHEVRVRAITKDGTVQTGVEADVLPDGATGWHSVDFSTALS
ncbi:MAG: molybdopterin-dependent oxidoreductase, partial [Nocardioides sp.]|nr:molybdopterin-dependent oxidoreductase [Nocardioides sp.]